MPGIIPSRPPSIIVDWKVVSMEHLAGYLEAGWQIEEGAPPYFNEKENTFYRSIILWKSGLHGAKTPEGIDYVPPDSLKRVEHTEKYVGRKCDLCNVWFEGAGRYCNRHRVEVPLKINKCFMCDKETAEGITYCVHCRSMS